MKEYIAKITNLQFIILVITNSVPPILGLSLTIQLNLYDFTVETHTIFSLMAVASVLSGFILLRFDFYLTYQKCLSSLPYVQSLILVLIVFNMIFISSVNFLYQQSNVVIIYNMAFGSVLTFLCVTVAIRKKELLKNFIFKILYTKCLILLVYLEFTNDFLRISQIHCIIIFCITIPYLLFSTKLKFYRFSFTKFMSLIKNNFPSMFTSSITNFNLHVPLLLLPSAEMNNKDVIATILRISLSALNPLILALRQAVQLKLTSFTVTEKFDLKTVNITLVLCSFVVVVNALLFYGFSNDLMIISIIIAVVFAIIARVASAQIALIYLNQLSEIKLLYTLIGISIPFWMIIGSNQTYEWIILNWSLLIVMVPMGLTYQLKVNT